MNLQWNEILNNIYQSSSNVPASPDIFTRHCFKVSAFYFILPQTGLRLGVKDDQGLSVSSPVRLSDEEWSVRRHRSDSTHTLYTEGYVQLSIMMVRQSCSQVSVRLHKMFCLLAWYEVHLQVLKSRLEEFRRVNTQKSLHGWDCILFLAEIWDPAIF